MRTPESRGAVGSDRLYEMQFEGAVESIAPIVNASGQSLRFAIIARDVERCRAKIRNGEVMRIITSYPNATKRLFPEVEVFYASGGIEAELIDQADRIDAAYELVQSGDSVRENGLDIVEDAIEFVELCGISLNLANNR